MKLPEEKTETSFVQPPALEKGIIMSLLECYIAPLFLPSVFLFLYQHFITNFLFVRCLFLTIINVFCVLAVYVALWCKDS